MGYTRQLPKAQDGGGGDGGTWQLRKRGCPSVGGGGRGQVMEVFRNVDFWMKATGSR